MTLDFGHWTLLYFRRGQISHQRRQGTQRSRFNQRRQELGPALHGRGTAQS